MRRISIIFLIIFAINFNIYADTFPKIGETKTISIGQSLIFFGKEVPSYIIVNSSAFIEYNKWTNCNEFMNNIVTENGFSGIKCNFTSIGKYGICYSNELWPMQDGYPLQTDDLITYKTYLNKDIERNLLHTSNNKVIGEIDTGFTYKLIFTGYYNGEIITFSYREFSDGSARQAFTLDLGFLISEKYITFRELEFEIININKNNLTYKRIK